MTYRSARVLLFVGAVLAAVLMNGCTHAFKSNEDQQPTLPARIVQLPGGAHELNVDREGLTYTGELKPTWVHIHRSKRNHLVQLYQADAVAEDGVSLHCELPTLSVSKTARCRLDDGTVFHLSEMNGGW